MENKREYMAKHPHNIHNIPNGTDQVSSLPTLLNEIFCFLASSSSSRLVPYIVLSNQDGFPPSQGGLREGGQ